MKSQHTSGPHEMVVCLEPVAAKSNKRQQAGDDTKSPLPLYMDSVSLFVWAKKNSCSNARNQKDLQSV